MEQLFLKEASEGDLALVRKWCGAALKKEILSDAQIAYLGEKPFGYIHSYQIDEESLCHPNGKTVGIDLVIGEASFAQSEYEQEVFRRYVDSLCWDIERVIVQPLEGDKRSIGIFANYGLREVSRQRVNGDLRIFMSIDLRRAVRGIIHDGDQKILLIHVKADPSKRNQRGYFSFWITPGGQVEFPETKEEALYREIREETGMHTVSLEKELGSFEETVLWGNRAIRFFQTYYLLRGDRAEVGKKRNLMKDEEEIFLGYRWWTSLEVEETEEVVFPRNLLEILSSSEVFSRFHGDRP